MSHSAGCETGGVGPRAGVGTGAARGGCPGRRTPEPACSWAGDGCLQQQARFAAQGQSVLNRSRCSPLL